MPGPFLGFIDSLIFPRGSCFFLLILGKKKYCKFSEVELNISGPTLLNVQQGKVGDAEAPRGFLPVEFCMFSLEFPLASHSRS